MYIIYRKKSSALFLSFLVSVMVTLLVFPTVDDSFTLANALTNWITYVYLLYFNFTVYISLKIDTFGNSIMPWETFQHRRTVIELGAIFVLTLIFFYITNICVGLMYNFENPFAFKQKSLLVGGLSSLILIFLMGFLISQDFLYNWQKSQQDVKELKQQKLEADYRVLQGQMNPHFLFNSLNVLVSEIDHDPAQAKIFALNLASVYRYVLQAKDKTVVTLAKEWEAGKSFLDLHQVRLGDGLIVEVDQQQGAALKKQLPPLSLHSLFENCIKHNIATLRKPLTIRVQITDELVVVSNNVQKSQKLPSFGIGLESIRNTYKLLKVEEPVLVEATENHFSVTLPLI